MSTMNDYTFQILAQQRHDDFLAEAANDRLVRIATSGPSELAAADPRRFQPHGCGAAEPHLAAGPGPLSSTRPTVQKVAR